MSDTKISGLAAGAPAQAGDLIPIARSGANYSITPANILAYGTSPVAGTSGTFSTTLGVTGASTLAALSATTGTFSSNVAVTGTGTFTGNVNLANNTVLRALNTDGVTYHSLIGLTQGAPTNQIGIGDGTRTIYMNGATAVTGTLSATGTFTGNGIGGNIFSGSVSGAGTYMAEVRNTNATASSATTAFTCALTGASDMTNARFITFYDADGQASAIGSISVASATTVAYNTSSDGRLKEDVQDFTGALDILAKVQPRSFVWKKDGKQDYGFIAQELREVYPYPVSGKGEPDEVLLQMDYGRITPLLAAAIKELAAKVAKLEAA